MADNLFVVLNGKVVGKLLSLDSSTEIPGNEGVARSTARQFTLGCGSGMDSSFNSWIADTFNSRPSTNDVSLVIENPFSSAQKQFSMYAAYVTGLGIPALDASQKTTAALKVLLAAESVKTEAGTKPLSAVTPTPWAISAFRLSISGFEKECIHIKKTGALSFGVGMKMSNRGAQRIPELYPTAVTFPNLVITLPSTYAESLEKWFSAAILAGINVETKTATLTLLTSDRLTELATIEFRGLIPMTIAKRGLDAEVQFACDDARIKFN